MGKGRPHKDRPKKKKKEEILTSVRLNVELLEDICADKEYSTEDLANLSALHRNTINNTKNAPDRVRLEVLAAIADALDTDPLSLLIVERKGEDREEDKH